jgi:hypothetical protein
MGEMMYNSSSEHNAYFGGAMDIKPFEEHKDQLFTDYAMQLFNAHCADDSHEMLKYLIESLEDEAEDNPAFLPGLVFGCMVHMLMMTQVISLEKDISVEEVNASYVSMYQKNRVNLAKMLGNRPHYAKNLIEKLIEEGDF